MNYVLKNLAAITCAVGFIAIGCSLLVAQFKPSRDASEIQFGQGAPGDGAPDLMNALMLKKIKTDLRANDAEWAIIAPRVQKVLRLQRVVQGPGMPGLGGLGPTPAPRADNDRGAVPPLPPKAHSVEAQVLLGKVDSLETQDDEIAQALKSLRNVRAKQRDELEKAQEDLRAALILRQEARLVLMGVLE